MHRAEGGGQYGIVFCRFPFIIGLCIAWQIIDGGGDGSGGWSVKDSRTYRLLVIETSQTRMLPHKR